MVYPVLAVFPDKNTYYAVIDVAHGALLRLPQTGALVPRVFFIVRVQRSRFDPW